MGQGGYDITYGTLSPDQEIMIGELKRCADEIASTDLNFQTIWDMIKETKEFGEGVE
jgi:putative GTP pyrophosphokinase